MNWNQKIVEIRQKYNRSQGRNVAIAIGCVGEDNFEIFAVSGKQSYGGVELPTQAVFELIQPPPGHFRGYDSEYKLLEYIGAKYIQNKKVKGNIELFTERQPCPSCEDIISQFRKLFPNTVINVRWKPIEAG